MRAQDHFLSRMTWTVLPLLVWATHFFFCYAWTAAACQRGHDPAAALGVASTLALELGGLLLFLALRRLRRSPAPWRLIDWVNCAVAALSLVALSLVALAWSCVPLLMLPPCGPA